ncbi:TetR/AcrR family transcriptional regulator [Murimonas intestini]|uniref:TetR/AcrR family transcriptional regulator n=1 Tax=Murimonas intestini TaxID=1337051 RepID=UPI0011DD8D7D|nr:TetR/AcrR family transcriptional regulator [Murimonas intestini]
MNKNVTSKEELIAAALKIAANEGIHKVSIRNIANECSISTGVIYNYFPTKADLIFSIVSSFWDGVSCELSDLSASGGSFIEFTSAYYNIIYKKISAFEQGWLTQMETLPDDDKRRGRELETQCFCYLKSLLADALKLDTSVSRDIWSEEYPMEEFIDFLFWHIMSMLRGRQEDCSFFLKTIKRILYK